MQQLEHTDIDRQRDSTRGIPAQKSVGSNSGIGQNLPGRCQFARRANLSRFLRRPGASLRIVIAFVAAIAFYDIELVKLSFVATGRRRLPRRLRHCRGQLQVEAHLRHRDDGRCCRWRSPARPSCLYIHFRLISGLGCVRQTVAGGRLSHDGRHGVGGPVCASGFRGRGAGSGGGDPGGPSSGRAGGDAGRSSSGRACGCTSRGVGRRVARPRAPCCGSGGLRVLRAWKQQERAQRALLRCPTARAGSLPRRPGYRMGLPSKEQ